MNSTTLIIDGNWLMMSRLYAVINDFDKRNTPEQLDQATNNLVEFLARSINKEINYFEGAIDNILMVQDGGSWRKKVDKPALYNEVYKGNRTHDETADWPHIWKSLNILCDNFHKNNITCTYARGIEGDDWCWFWSRWLNERGANAIIWSSDCDLKQLVCHNPDTDTFTAWYNDKVGLIASQDMEDYDGFVDNYFTPFNKLRTSISGHGGRIGYINPDDITMSKVVCGDSGDNIKALIRARTGNLPTSRVNRISEKEWKAIQERLDITDLTNFTDSKNDIIDEALKIKRLNGCKDSIDDLGDMFDYNMKLVCLDCIPNDIIQVMESHSNEYQEADLGYLINNYKVLANPDPSLSGLFDQIEEWI